MALQQVHQFNLALLGDGSSTVFTFSLDSYTGDAAPNSVEVVNPPVPVTDITTDGAGNVTLTLTSPLGAYVTETFLVNLIYTVGTAAGVTPITAVGVNPTVIIANNSLAVTGTFWQAIQPISGAVSFTAPQHVIIDSATLGTVTVSGSVTANAGTNLNTSALALESGGNLATIAGAISSNKVQVNVTNASLPVTGTFWQATQPISATSLPLPSNASQETGGNLATIAGAVSSNKMQVNITNASLAVTGTFWQATQPVSLASLPSLAAGGNAIGSVSVSNFPATQPVSGTVNTLAAAGTSVNKTGNLVTTAVTANQVILTYTVTAGKTLYLQYLNFVANLTTVPGNSNPTLLGTISLMSPAGTTLYSSRLVSLYDARETIYFDETLQIPSGTVIEVVCTPAATTSFTWYANFGGQER